ncbi:hypothetical protein MASR2M48_11550 [Spirochaetota bacterium]
MLTKKVLLSLAVCLALTAMILSCDLLNIGNEGNELLADNVIKVEYDITSATTWLEGKVYYVVDDITVRTGATLVIQPGTIVKFKAACSLATEDGATINASGTAGKPIYFTSILDSTVGGDSIKNDGNTAPVPGSWNYLYISNGSNSNKFIYCHIRYSGGYEWAALNLLGQAQIDHCVFSENLCGLQPWSNSYAALHIQNATGVTVTNNLFYHNRWPLAMPSNLSINATNRFSYDHDNNGETPLLTNTYQGICVNTTEMAGITNWTETEVPYCLFDNLAIDTSMTFTIADGAVLKMTGNEIDKHNGGTFNYGTTIFTSYKDDAHGGDTNADGTASSPSVGDWEGIWLDETNSWLPNGAQILYSANH